MVLKLITSKQDIRAIVTEADREGKVVGLVPTMGFFHEGHLELMRSARSECDLVVVSIFVNPTQFAPGEDLDSYPRDLERDTRMASTVGVDYIFHPSVEEMYQQEATTTVEVSGMSEIMCGASRPTHFRGVATIVSKLFNIVAPHKAYFGQKDAQQAAIVRRMASDLDFPVEIVLVPTVREADGLAMSSRNIYLTDEERVAATVLPRSLALVEEMVRSGERNADVVRKAVEAFIAEEPLVDLEYAVICDNIFLRPCETLEGQVLVALAARVGRARLIDNVLLEIE